MASLIVILCNALRETLSNGVLDEFIFCSIRKEQLTECVSPGAEFHYCLHITELSKTSKHTVSSKSLLNNQEGEK